MIRKSWMTAAVAFTLGLAHGPAIAQSGPPTSGSSAALLFAPATVNLVAGLNGPGDTGNGGLATAAQLDFPMGVAYDSNGNLYIADSENFEVRVISSATGDISVFAGTGSFGNSISGLTSTTQATTWPLGHLAGLVIDSSDNVYFADRDTEVVWKVNTSGVISVYAGDGSLGYSGDGSAATSATLDNPQGLAFDGSGNLYIADSNNNVVRVVGTNENINTFAGNGTGHGQFPTCPNNIPNLGPPAPAATSVALCSPQGVAADPSGNIYVSSYTYDQVYIVGANGDISVFAGTGADYGDTNCCYTGDGGPAASAQLWRPSGLYADPGGDIYIVDQFGGFIREVYASGIIDKVYGDGEGDVTHAIIGEPDDEQESTSVGDADGIYFITMNAQGNLIVPSADAYVVLSAGSTGQYFFGNNNQIYETATTTSLNAINPNFPPYLTISNPSGVTLNLTGTPAITGPFSIVGGTCSFPGSVAPGGSCTVVLGFTPTVDGLATGSIVLDSNANSSPTTITLSGSGTGFVSPSATLTPSPLPTFSSPVSVTSAQEQATLTNTSFPPAAPITITGAAIGGTNPSEFSIASTTCPISPATLAGGASCYYYVTFTPAAETTYHAQLQVTVASYGTLAVSLNGTGTAPETPTATPVISPPAGTTYNAPVAVQITDATANSTIYDTTDGTTPTTSLPPYTAPLIVTNGTLVQAIATASGDSTSATASSTYTVQPYLSFNAAAVGIAPGSAQTLTATFSLVGTTPPTATLHYGLDYSAGAVSCTPNGAIEVCTVPVTFIPTLPGARKDALFLMNGTTQLASVLLGGVGQAPLSLVQPGVVTNPIANNPNYFYNSTVDENGTAYVLGDNSNTVVSVTKAGVVSTLPITGIQSPSGIAVDGAGVLYISQNTYSHTLVTYNTVTGVQGTLCVAPPALGLSCTSTTNNEYLISVAVDQFGNVFTTEILSNNVFELTPEGVYVVTPINPAITQPYELTVDSSDNIFVGGYAINEIPAVGTQSQVNTTGASEGIAVDAADSLYATRYSVPPYDIAELPASGYATPLAGLDGGTTNETVSPLGLGLGSDGTLFVGDYNDLDKVDRTQGAISFGEQVTGTTSAPQNVGIYNGGNEPLTLQSFALTGSASGFAIQAATSNDCTTGLVIQPGALCQVAVTLTPPNAGVFSGSITFTTNSLNTTSTVQSVALSGFVYGVYVTASPNPLNFPNQLINTTSAVETVTLTNSGDLYTAIIGTPTGAGNAYAISLGNCVSGIAPGASCQLSVTFDPPQAQAYDDTVSITVNSSGGGPAQNLTFAVNGTGTAAGAGASLSTTPLAFTNQVVGSTSEPLSATLTNTGTVALSISGITIAGTNPTDFAVLATGTNVCGTTLAAGAICNIYVTFTPATAASFSATLQVADNAPGSPQTLAITGAGVGFVSNVGTAEAAQAVTVNIATGGTLNQIQVLTQGAANLDFTFAAGGTCATATPYTVGQTCTVNVVFTPQFAGGRNGAVLLTDVSNNVLGTAYLPGTGFGPQIVYGPGTIVAVPNTTVGTWGVAVDGSLNVYLNNTNFATVDQIPWTGSGYGSPVTIASDIAGDFAKSIAVDGAGNVYVGSNEPGQIITRIPRTSTGWGPQVNIPTTGVGGAAGIAVDGTGSLYIADSSGQVEKLPWTGDGFGTQITLPATGLISPYGVAVDAGGNVYIADHDANIVVELPWTGSGYGTQTTVPSAGLTSLTGLAVDGTSNLYVAGATGTTSDIVRIPWSGSAYGTPTVLPGFDYTQVAVDSAGNVYGNESLYANSAQGIVKIDLADAPSLTFANTNVGSTSSDSPKTVPIYNIGNIGLYFSAIFPNPVYPVNFPVNSNDNNLCEADNTVDIGMSCDVSVNFTPTTAGALSGDVVLTDNNLNVSGATQSIAVSGTGVSTGLIPQTITFNQPTTPVTYSSGLTIPLVATGGGSGNPVVFTIDSSSTGAGSITGSTLSVTGVGTFVIDANQAGNSTYAAAPQVQRTVVVNQASQTIAFAQPTSPVVYSGTSVNVSLSATGGASGNPVVFTIDASSTATGSISGATLTVSSTGNLVIDANQAGNTDYSAAAQVQRTVVVNAPTPQAIVFAQPTTPVTYSSGLSIPLVATGGGSGNPVVFTIDSSSTGTGSITGSTLSVTIVGVFVIDANQAGNTTYSAAPQVQRTVVVNQAPQAINFTQPTSPEVYTPGLTITLAATGGASGIAVVFTIDSSSTATGTISGSTLTPTSTGTLVIDANQAGNADFTAAPQAAVSIVLNAPPPDFSISVTPPSQSIAVGATATYTVNVASSGSTFNNPVTLSLSGAPPGATVGFSPASITPGGLGGQSTLTVTPAAGTFAQVRSNPWPLATPALALLFLLPFRRWRRAFRGRLMLLVAGLASLAAFTALTGCGGGFGFQQNQNYTLTITGTAGTDTHTTTVQLTVQQ